MNLDEFNDLLNEKYQNDIYAKLISMSNKVWDYLLDKRSIVANQTSIGYKPVITSFMGIPVKLDENLLGGYIIHWSDGEMVRVIA